MLYKLQCIMQSHIFNRAKNGKKKKKKTAWELGLIVPGAKLSYFLLLPGWESEYDFISIYSQ